MHSRSCQWTTSALEKIIISVYIIVEEKLGINLVFSVIFDQALIFSHSLVHGEPTLKGIHINLRCCVGVVAPGSLMLASAEN